MKNNSLVSIVVPTYNRKHSAERLIRSILDNTYKNVEIIVIDDASPDRTKEYLNKKFSKNKKIKIFKNKKNLFAAGAKNEGLKRAKGKYVSFIDDDNVLDRKMISELVHVLEKDFSVGEVGPINYNFNNKNHILLTRSTRNMWTTKTSHLRSLNSFNSKKTWEADDVPNAFMVRLDLLKKYKIKFNSDYGIMYEESDFAYRIRNAGYKVLMVRKAKIFHDIEGPDKKSKDYLYHFLEDPRRPFVFARNRLIFHNIYSSNIQKIGIFIFWVWFFTLYYSYKFIFYNKDNDFSYSVKLKAAVNYIKGTFFGYKKVFVN